MSGEVQIIDLENVEKIDLPGGSWSRMLLNESTLTDNQSALGYSIFKPNTATSPVSHQVEELAFVVAGTGELRVGEKIITYGPGNAIYIPAHTWHAVANTGNEDVIMVFTFPYPDYPPTERR